MSTLIKRGVYCDTYIILSQTRNFGHIIESNTKDVGDNIFDLYDMPLSELEYIRREMLLGSSSFAALTQSGRVLMFLKLKRSSYIMGVCCVSIECLKNLTLIFDSINTSPTLTRRLRRCEADGECEDICGLLSLYSDSGNDAGFGGEFIYKSILEYSSVYNLNVRIDRSVSLDESPVGAILCGEMLHLFLHFLFIVSSKCNTEIIDVSLREIADRVIINTRIDIEDASGFNISKLEELESIADTFFASLEYRLEDGKIKMMLCPYYIDDSQHGLKSKIQFDF